MRQAIGRQASNKVVNRGGQRLLVRFYVAPDVAVAPFVPNKGGGMIVDKQGGRGSEGYKGSVKIPPKK